MTTRIPPSTGMRLADLAERAGATLDGDGEVRISGVGALHDAAPGTIAFLADPKYRPQLASTRASAVIVTAEDAAGTELPKLVSSNPYATYARVATLLHPPPTAVAGIHPSAVIDATARIAPDAEIGAHAVIGARTVVGARAFVGPHCVIGADVELGDAVRLVARVCIYDRCRIGARTIVQAGAVIGSDGFGMAEEAGRWVKIPQVGRVLVGEDCEIGANTTIDRGAIGDTVIEDDVKLDNQIQIGHNCTIGRHTAMAGCVGIAGSVKIGRNVKLGGSVGVSGHLEIADGVVVGGGTVVGQSLREPGVYTGVFPLLPYREWQFAASHTRRLRALVDRVRALERALEAAQGHRSQDG